MDDEEPPGPALEVNVDTLRMDQFEELDLADLQPRSLDELRLGHELGHVASLVEA